MEKIDTFLIAIVAIFAFIVIYKIVKNFTNKK